MATNDRRIDEAIRRGSGERLAAQAEEKILSFTRDRALDRADRREWADKKFVVGGEFRWQETLSEARGYGRRRYVYDPKTDRVVEIN